MINEIKKLAQIHNWTFITYQEDISMLSFKKMINNNKARINIYLTKMTVGTYLNHPTKGKTQLFRKKVSMESLGKIFKNPRVHTNKGYYTK